MAAILHHTFWLAARSFHFVKIYIWLLCRKQKELVTQNNQNSGASYAMELSGDYCKKGTLPVAAVHVERASSHHGLDKSGSLPSSAKLPDHDNKSNNPRLGVCLSDMQRGQSDHTYANPHSAEWGQSSHTYSVPGSQFGDRRYGNTCHTIRDGNYCIAEEIVDDRVIVENDLYAKMSGVNQAQRIEEATISVSD